MAKCEVCGNEYHNTFQVIQNNETHTFDSFECAVQAMAPLCAHCSCRVIGHGVESHGNIYCCQHCSENGDK